MEPFPPLIWTKCNPGIGELIDGTSIIPIKSPYINSKTFKPGDIIEEVKRKYKRKVGMIINLSTNTKKVFYKEENIPEGVLYERISFENEDDPIKHEEIEKFFKKIKNFKKKDIILVHDIVKPF
jgi:hypothetical protein